jgi:hypothetical protein
MDVARFMRLQGTVQAAINSVDERQALISGMSLMETYTRLRSEVYNTIGDAERGEFTRLFPKMVDRDPSTNASPEEAKQAWTEARALLTQMSGWLEGYVRQAQMTLEAQAYAEERVRAERGVGFKPDEK